MEIVFKTMDAIYVLLKLGMPVLIHLQSVIQYVETALLKEVKSAMTLTQYLMTVAHKAANMRSGSYVQIFLLNASLIAGMVF